VSEISLKDLLKQKGGFTPNNIILVLCQLLVLLEFCNKKGYCYGPVSCEDIFVSEDFGLKLAHSPQLNYQILGSEFFSEKFKAEELQKKLHEYLGKNCFEQDMKAIGKSDISHLSSIIFTMATCLSVERNSI
jgi:hypothetical protein